MVQHTLRSCPICLTQDAEVLHTQQFAIPSDVPLPNEYNIVSCRNCHFVYADTPNNQQQYEKYYALHAKYESATTSAQDDQRHFETANYLENQFSKHWRIMDIGSANGDLLHKLLNKGYEQLTGVDPSPSSAQHMAKIGLKNLTLTLSDLHDDKNKIEPQDAIILSHVMEHLVDPCNMMAALKKLLNPNGLVYIEVPDASRYADYFFKSFHYFDVEHINHFDTESLTNLAKLAGFEILDSGLKTIPVSKTVSIPAVYILLKNQQTSEKTVTPSTKLTFAMKEYIQLSRKEQDQNVINTLASSQEPIILWGVGSYAQNLFKSSSLKQCNIIGIIDRDPKKQGLSLLGKTIQNPRELLKGEHANVPILIASIPFAKEIAADILEMGLNNPILIA